MRMLQILGQIDPDNNDKVGIDALIKLLKSAGYQLVANENKTWYYIVRDLNKPNE